MKKYLVGICSYNEGEKIKRVIEKFNDYASYDVLIVDDGSSDGSIARLPKLPSIILIRNFTTCGAGYGTRQIIDYAREKKYAAAIFVAGNDKDSAEDIGKLIGSIEAGYDFVQGSRYLKGGRYGQMPFYRIIATRFLHPILFSIITRRWITDSTNGFRAVRSSLAAVERRLYQNETADRLVEYPAPVNLSEPRHQKIIYARKTRKTYKTLFGPAGDHFYRVGRLAALAKYHAERFCFL